MPTKRRLIERAMAARLNHSPGSPGEPSAKDSTVEEYGGLTYVVLRRGHIVLDIYRYKEATPAFRDTLVRLKRNLPGPYKSMKLAYGAAYAAA